jgi:hypothetical protein
MLLELLDDGAVRVLTDGVCYVLKYVLGVFIKYKFDESICIDI